jgi:LPS-assembly protein
VKRILNRILLVVTALIAITPVRASSPPLAEEFDDWVISPGTHQLCEGYYCEAPAPFPGKPKEFLEQQPTTITANRGEFHNEGSSTLNGEVHLIQGNRQLTADRAIINRSATTHKLETVTALGGVRLLEPGLRLDGTHANVYVPQNKQTIYNARYRLYGRHARGTASTIEVFNKTRMILKNATYTTCNPFQNIWILKAREVNLNTETGRGHARHAYMTVKDIPVFYFPYVDFPIDNRRQTGFLFPNFSNTNNSGFEIATPFYWNIAPNYDATLTPRILSKRGPEVQGQFRYLLPRSTGSLSGTYLSNDRAYRQFRNKSLANPKFPSNDPRITALKRKDNSRRALSAQHTTVLSPNWHANLNYNAVGDDNYFMDLGNSLNTAGTNYLRQQADLSYYDEYWVGRARLQSHQTLHPYNGPVTQEPYQRAPQLTAQNFYPDLPYGFEWAMRTEFTNFAHKRNPFNQDPFTTGNRFYMRPNLTYPMTGSYWFVKPRIQYDIAAYSLVLSPADRNHQYLKNPNRHIPMFDIDTGLTFERNYNTRHTHFVQTLEPRAYYLYIPYKNQNLFPNFESSYPGFDYNQLYRDNRFSGLDRLGDTNQVTLGVTNRFLEGNTGSERLNLSAGQILYFKDRKVTTCNNQLNPECIKQELPNHKRRCSPLAALARLHLQEVWNANTSIEWDTYRNRRDKTSFWVQYHPSQLNVLNAGFQFLRRNPAKMDPRTLMPEQLQQFDTSGAWVLNEQWRFLGRWNYDIRNHRSNEMLAGLEQQGCCTAVRLSLMRYLLPNDGQKRYTNGVFFQFIFKGFAGVGHRQVNTLSRSIPGYQWRGDAF